jgi:serine/threonine protein phosphatase PrpC
MGQAFWSNWNKIRGWTSKDNNERSVQVQSFGLTHVGKRRSLNQDTIFFSDDLALYLVADGMGGHAQGEVASAMAIETISQARQAADTSSFSLADAIQRANDRIYHYAGKNLPSRGSDTLMAGMGTTVVALQIDRDIALIAHVGDSRAYRLRGGKLSLLTQDHSLTALAATTHTFAQVPIRTGFKNIITRAVGLELKVEVDVRQEKLLPNDLFLLCSDGLTNMVSDQRIEETLASVASIQSACESLVDEANRNGGKDNISAVLIRFTP